MAASGNVQSVAQSMGRPGNVKDPVPGEADQMALDQAMNDTPPTMVAQTQQVQDAVDERNYQTRDAQTSADDALLDDLVLNEALGVGDSAQEQVPIEPTSTTFLGANLDIPEQLDALPARIRASFGKTDKEKQSILENYLGKDNVKKVDDNFLVKLPGKNAFRKLDPEAFDLVGDMFADNFRDSIAQMFGIGGATAAALAQGPLIVEPVTTGAAGTAGYALGTSMGDSLMDVFAEQYLGMQRDVEARGEGVVARTGEALQYGAMSAAFNKVMERAMKLGGDKWKQMFGDKAKLKQAIKEATDIPEHEKLSLTVKQAQETIDDLQKLDLLPNLPGTDVPLLAHQMLPDTKDAQMLAQSVKNNRAFETLQNQASKNLSDTILDMVETAGNLGKGTLTKVIARGDKTAKGALQQDIGDLLESSVRAEGKLIGDFRKKVSVEMAGQPLQLNKTKQYIEEFFSEVGDQVLASDDELARFLGTDNKAIIRGFKKDISELMNGADSGVSIDQLTGKIKLMKNLLPAASRLGGQYKRWMNRFTSGLREDARNGMTEILSPDDAMAYANSMKKFAQFSGARDQLENTLKIEMGSNTFAKALFNGGRQGLANLKAVKGFLKETDPQLWDNLRTEFFEELVLSQRKVGGKGGIEYGIQGLRSKLNSYGDDFLNEMFPSGGKVGGAGQIRRALDLAQHVQNVALKGTDDDLVKAGKEAVGGLSQFLSSKVNTAMALFRFGTADNRLMKLMSKEGVETFLEKVPEKQKGAARKTLEAVLAYGRSNKILSTIGSTARGSVQYAPEAALRGVGIGTGISESQNLVNRLLQGSGVNEVQ